jgi:hypothetical protein
MCSPALAGRTTITTIDAIAASNIVDFGQPTETHAAEVRHAGTSPNGSGLIEAHRNESFEFRPTEPPDPVELRPSIEPRAVPI